MSTPTPTSKNRKGFSLILALTMMTMIVFVVIVLAAFLNVESRAAATFHLATRARLNALMSGRLALAHLQQTAGPDRRATATGDLTGAAVTTSALDAKLSNSERIPQGQPYWTGVWRTDKPDQPPAWLISGKGGQDVTKATTCYTAQSVSTWGKDISGNDLTDYNSNNSYWLPWQNYDQPNPSLSTFAVLVGNGSAVLNPSDKNDGRIALPKIPLPGITQGSTMGNYAYWIGDEGVKARINLKDSRYLTDPAPTSDSVINALRSPGRLGTELLTGLLDVAVNQPELNPQKPTASQQLASVTSTQQLALVDGYTTTTNGLDSRKLSFHNQTLWSSGVLADSFRGGLKRDLSLAFEMDDIDFDNSDFGSGARSGGGVVTELYDTTASPRNSAFPQLGIKNITIQDPLKSPTDPRPRVWVPMYEKGNNNPDRALTSGVSYLQWSPVFLREDKLSQKRFVGPLWHVLRDYYRLYKEIDWSSDTATLPARSFFPNTLQFSKDKGGYNTQDNGPLGSNRLYSPYEYEAAYACGPYGIATYGDDTSTFSTRPKPTMIDPIVGYGSGYKSSKGYAVYYPGANHNGDPLGQINPVIGRDNTVIKNPSDSLMTTNLVGFIPRVTRSAYMPVIHRVSLVFSIKGQDGKVTTFNGTSAGAIQACQNVYLICTPIVVLHNPYNVKLKLRPANSETDPVMRKDPSPSSTDKKGAYVMRISFSGFDQINIQYRDRLYRGTNSKIPSLERSKWQMNKWTDSPGKDSANIDITPDAYNRYARSLLNLKKYVTSGNDVSSGEYEHLAVGILNDDTALEPGEFAVFSSEDLLDNNSYNGTGGQLDKSLDDSQVRVLPLKRGCYYTGGFYGQLAWGSSDLSAGPSGFRAASYNDDDELYFGMKIGRYSSSGSPFSNTEFGYLKYWTNIISGWKGNKFGAIDQVNDKVNGKDSEFEPGFLEELGTSKYSCKAGSGQTVYVGSWIKPPDDKFWGNAGQPTSWDETKPWKITDYLVFVKKAKELNRMFNADNSLNNKTPGNVFGVIDTRIRVSDTVRDTPDGTSNYRKNGLLGSLTTAPAAHPTWLFTNPIAVSSSNTPLGGLPAIGNASLRTQVFGGDQLYFNWSEILSINDSSDPIDKKGGRAFGGPSHSVKGFTSVIDVEIPQTPPVSIGQLMHANVSVSDLFPYRTVGNSFPNTVVPLDKSWTFGTPTVTQYSGNATFADMSYLMNNALWDSFFFSGAAPVLKSNTVLGKTGDYNSVRNMTTQDVLNNFAAGTGKLANPTMRLYQPFGISDAPYAFGFTGDGSTPAFINTANPITATTAPDGWKKMSSYLLNDGAFNVNSTSVEAWTALYASLKGLGVGSDNTTTSNARFPRIIGPTGQVISENNLKKSSYWTGFINLSDTQIKALAEATVAEVKARAKFFYRTERDQDYTPLTRRFSGFPATQEPATPFMGMCEFINRFLGPTKSLGANYDRSLYTTDITGTPWSITFPAPLSNKAACPNDYKWMIRSGTLESAIARTDLGSIPPSTSEIKTKDSYNWGSNGSTTGMPPGLFWQNIEILTPKTSTKDSINRTHNGFGAAGCLFQGDLLQALGPRLATRSDTFTIRAYGEATDDSGANANCVIELVVQRTPEYIDNKTQPHERIEDLAKSDAKNINSLLGRRFIVISARWLSKSEI